mmetsp:Transcript_38846/g.109921  ORF Transcript_38846/g.109921 Transcript_38846/m.109921 type:complete len:221 (-) Transcript_38846:1423-2085(-)
MDSVRPRLGLVTTHPGAYRLLLSSLHVICHSCRPMELRPTNQLGLRHVPKPDYPVLHRYGDITMLKGLSWNGICKGGNQCCMAKEALDYMGMSLSQWVCLAARNNLTVTTHMWGEFTIDDFRSALQQMDASSLVALNFDRRGVKQYGGGHFSPIAGYNSKRDMVLVTDVARFKYPPWWAPVEMVFNSMSDSFNGTQRGFAVVTPGPGSPAGLFPASLQVT